MRIRSIKPEFWRSADVAALIVEDRLLFIGLWSYVDDNGVGRDELHAILGDLFAADMVASPRETVARVQRGLERLETLALITRYRVDGKPFLAITAWKKHQKIDRPSPGRYPGPDQAEPFPSTSPREDASSPRRALDAGTGEQGNRGTEEQTSSTSDEVEEERTPRKRAARLPEPFIVTKEMRSWAATETPSVDVDASTRTFVDHWRSMSGKNATRLDWTATWRNWLRRDEKSATQRPRAIGVRESSLARRDQQFLDTDNELARREATRNGRTGSEPLALPAFGVRPA